MKLIKKHLSKVLLVLSVSLFSSCTTYIIPVESFKQQMVSSNKTNLKDVEVNNPLINNNKGIRYQANQIEKILVQTKNGEEFQLRNSPSIEMRITLSSGKRRILYFDTVFLENDTLKGSNSRFLGTYKSYPIKDIIKIEVQDGGKNFNYKN